METKLEFLRGTLDVLILKALVWGPLHGYVITSLIRRQSDPVISRNGDGIYVTNVMLDGKPFPTDWLPVEKIRPGVTRLDFATQAEPDTKRGTKVEDRPPSLR